ncbi:RHS repeat-associated core domain-containing protein [Curtobacterium citreum]|uniref:RHS repeat-associated core domain-containing protein n=1 Tax=Curtobacterium citreum TaxID=2036 RepID=UPI00187CB078
MRLDWDAAAAVPALLTVDDSPVLRTPVGLLGSPDGTGPSGWRAARSTSDDDPWQLLASFSGEPERALAFGADGTPVVAGLEWMGARAYDPATRGFLSTDPVTAPAGAAWGANPYSFAGNDPLHAVDPLGLAPITDAELEAYAAAEQGPLARAAAATGDWFKDNWEYVAGGAMVVAGGALMLTGVGGPLGGMLIGAGADTIIQKATTGEVNWGQVAVSGAFGAVGGGLGAAIGKHFVENAVEGAVENVANTVVSGQPLTPGKLLGSATEGAAMSAATGGTMSKLHLPTAVNRLDDLAPAPPVNILPSSNRTFVATPDGTIFDIPGGWNVGPARSGKGLVAQDPVTAANPLAHENADMVRIMDPTEQYPNGYSRYSNSHGQWLDPNTGKPGSKPASHIPWDHEGEYSAWPK